MTIRPRVLDNGRLSQYAENIIPLQHASQVHRLELSWMGLAKVSRDERSQIYAVGELDERPHHPFFASIARAH